MIEAAIVGTVAHGNVGCLTLHVLARWRAAHLLIEPRATESAVHLDRFAPRLAQRVENMFHQLVKVGDCFLRGGVVDATQFGCSRASKFV